MTAQNFLSLHDQRREAVLITKGIYLAQRETADFVYDLYQVDSFYVEFCYSISENSTVTTAVFTDLDCLAPYRGQFKAMND